MHNRETDPLLLKKHSNSIIYIFTPTREYREIELIFFFVRSKKKNGCYTLESISGEEVLQTRNWKLGLENSSCFYKLLKKSNFSNAN